MPLRIVMMGTGPFALPAFRQLLDSPHAVEALVTQPDRRGRGHHRHVNPLAELARERGVPVLQPENINTAESVAELESLQADLAVVAAYGQILKPAVLAATRLGAVNLHGSLLPRHRGAAPVQYAVLEGDAETGVTIFQIEPKLDAGPVLSVVRTPIGSKETSGELMERLADLAAPLTVETVDGLERGDLVPQVQDAAGVTRAPQIRKSDGLVDWTQPACRIEQMIRAYQPWPLAVSFVQTTRKPRSRLILLEADVMPAVEAGPAESATPAAGEVVAVERDRLLVQTGDGVLAISRVRPEGRRAMAAGDWLRGAGVAPGDRLGGAEAAADGDAAGG